MGGLVRPPRIRLYGVDGAYLGEFTFDSTGPLPDYVAWIGIAYMRRSGTNDTFNYVSFPSISPVSGSSAATPESDPHPEVVV